MMSVHVRAALSGEHLGTVAVGAADTAGSLRRAVVGAGLAGGSGAAGVRLVFGPGALADHEPLASAGLRGGSTVLLALAPRGGLVATASQDGTARVWSASDAACLAELRGHRGGVNHAAFSGDAAHLVTASADGQARLWRLEDGSCPVVFAGHHEPVNTARLSPDGSLVLTASDDGTARLWRAEDGTCLHASRATPSA
ncbi:unnamed protein product [Prorocentrum cordatum]|uniref:Ubiquitin-like domain-containing protein n=1 Tax=Prorocentrum cordatum TaxID=2364126 RepID=A0ABN9T7S9_9DINO|nr:unnamed protein product [Polarella glacialis]